MGAPDWPGNIRELRNAIERLLILATGPAVAAQDVSGLPAWERRTAARGERRRCGGHHGCGRPPSRSSSRWRAHLHLAKLKEKRLECVRDRAHIGMRAAILQEDRALRLLGRRSGRTWRRIATGQRDGRGGPPAQEAAGGRPSSAGRAVANPPSGGPAAAGGAWSGGAGGGPPSARDRVAPGRKWRWSASGIGDRPGRLALLHGCGLRLIFYLLA